MRSWKARGGVGAGVGGGGQDHNTGFSLFQLEIELTSQGLNAAPGLGLRVAQLLFDYIAMLKQLGPQAWIWEEMKGLNECNFRCAHTLMPGVLALDHPCLSAGTLRTIA